MASRVWQIKGYKGSFTDEELIELIKSGRITGKDALMSKEIKQWIKIEDSIYQFYIKEDQDEII